VNRRIVNLDGQRERVGAQQRHYPVACSNETSRLPPIRVGVWPTPQLPLRGDLRGVDEHAGATRLPSTARRPMRMAGLCRIEGEICFGSQS